MEIQLTKPEGSLPFTVESILLRELGERLVKRPEVALIELIKNSYDADATECKIYSKSDDSITIFDDGVGMTLDQFQNGWLRIGTQHKSENHQSLKYLRDITGEKGLGRFSVRFLGNVLNLKTIALDPKLGHLTQITTEFDWREIDKVRDIEKDEKKRLITVLSQTFERAEKQDEVAREREQRLEIMSLLGVVAGYMTHEFGVAIHELELVRKECLKLANGSPKFNQSAIEFEKSIQTLKDFAMYTAGYIHGSKHTIVKKYPVKPRISQVIKFFGKYANSRNIEIINEIDSELFALLVPAALYNGIALNLYTNAIKAITAKISNKTEKIVFRAWDETNWHVFEVLDSGIGIPVAIKDRVFEPFFTATDTDYHPLGSGMGLGLALVQRVVKAFGGYVDFHQAPTGFSTCIKVKLPLVIKNEKSST